MLDAPAINPILDTHFIVMHDMTAWAAFNSISNILQLACTEGLGFNVRASSTTLPASIVPTSQQQIIPHMPYVDMLPWSIVRDRLLSSLAAINEVELVQDLASGNVRIWGCIPWDTRSWEVSAEFANKWWFLVDNKIVDTTNFWRGQRGEPDLVLAQHKGISH